HEDLLAESLRELLSDGARHRVGPRPRRIRDDQPDAARGIPLRRCGLGPQNTRHCHCDERPQTINHLPYSIRNIAGPLMGISIKSSPQITLPSNTLRMSATI